MKYIILLSILSVLNAVKLTDYPVRPTSEYMSVMRSLTTCVFKDRWEQKDGKEVMSKKSLEQAIISILYGTGDMTLRNKDKFLNETFPA